MSSAAESVFREMAKTIGVAESDFVLLSEEGILTAQKFCYQLPTVERLEEVVHTQEVVRHVDVPVPQIQEVVRHQPRVEIVEKTVHVSKPQIQVVEKTYTEHVNVRMQEGPATYSHAIETNRYAGHHMPMTYAHTAPVHVPYAHQYAGHHGVIGVDLNNDGVISANEVVGYY